MFTMPEWETEDSIAQKHQYAKQANWNTEQMQG